MTPLVAAVDAGGTKTAAALADIRGEVSFLPPAPGCNPQDNPGWADVLGGVLGTLAARRGLAGAVLGLPGHGEVPAHDVAMAALVAARLPVPAEILNDVTLAFHGAFPGGAGVLVLSGTGSMAIAAGPDGMARAGGWGDLIGDEGSAHWIGTQALRHAAMEDDGRAPASGFGPALMAALGVAGQPFGPLAYVMAAPQPRPAIAAVAAQVDALAIAGNPQARALLTAAAGHLALAARTVAARAGLKPPLSWAPAGSAFRSATLRAALAQDLGAQALAPAMPPLGGGLLRAARAAGWTVDGPWQARVAAATRAWG